MKAATAVLLVLSMTSALAASRSFGEIWEVDDENQDQTIWDLVQSRPDLTELRDLLLLPEYAPYQEVLSSAGKHAGVKMTLFAPNNDAVGLLRKYMDYEQYKHFAPLVKATLNYHIGLEVTFTDSLLKKSFLETFARGKAIAHLPNDQGQVIQLVKDGKAIRISYGLRKKHTRGTIIEKDLACANGVVHIIDRVLLLPRHTTTMMGFAYLNAFIEVAINKGMAHDLNYDRGITVFAPSEEAFLHFFTRYGKDLEEGDLEKILSYHIVDDESVWYTDKLRLGETKELDTRFGDDVLRVALEGDDIFINDEELVLEDILTSNGVVHVIDKVLVPASMQNKLGIFDEE